MVLPSVCQLSILSALWCDLVAVYNALELEIRNRDGPCSGAPRGSLGINERGVPYARNFANGASPSGSEMIDCAISYVGCAVNSRDPKEGRVDVIKELLALGAAPSDKRPFKYPLDQHMHRALDQAGLLQLQPS